MDVLLRFVLGVLVVGLLFWALQRLIQAFKIAEPIASVLLVVFVVLVVAWLAGVLTGRPFLVW